MQMNSKAGFMRNCKLHLMKVIKIRQIYKQRYKNTKLLRQK